MHVFPVNVGHTLLYSVAGLIICSIAGIIFYLVFDPLHMPAAEALDLATQFEVAADGLQQAQGSEPRDIACVFGHVKAHTHVAFGPQVVDFVRLDVVEQVCEPARHGQVAVVEGIDSTFPLLKKS